jgi:hypothetical protein
MMLHHVSVPFRPLNMEYFNFLAHIKTMKLKGLQGSIVDKNKTEKYFNANKYSTSTSCLEIQTYVLATRNLPPYHCATLSFMILKNIWLNNKNCNFLG